MPDVANISDQRLIECIASARLWSTHLREKVDEMRARADKYTISASLISTATGLAAWGQIAASTRLWAQALVGVAAIASAAVAVIPKVKGYRENAASLAPLATRYGSALGGLIDALAEVQSGNSNGQIHARIAIDAFENVKKEKDEATLPTGLQGQIDRLRSEAIAVEAADKGVKLQPRRVA